MILNSWCINELYFRKYELFIIYEVYMIYNWLGINYTLGGMNDL